MSSFRNHPCDNRCHQAHNDVVLGNSIDINIAKCKVGEIRADVIVEPVGDEECEKVVRLWGQVKDCNNYPVSYALLKLVKVICTGVGMKYKGIAHTVSDCEGFYQFDLCYCDGNECYKVLVSKTYTGPEQCMETEEGNCCACQDEDDGNNVYYGYHGRKEYAPVIHPPNQCTCKKPSCNCKDCKIDDYEEEDAYCPCAYKNHIDYY